MLQTENELAELYVALSTRLKRLVRFDVDAPEAVIEDACQSAWSRLFLHAGHVEREATLAWLIRTATRDARRQIQRRMREVPLVDELELRTVDPEELLDARERLNGMTSLPRRQQRLLWLQGVGLNYAEMADHERCTRRTVERQLLRARRSLRAVATQ